MTSKDANKRPERTYNKDRIQRIKEAAEQMKQNNPNWYNDAPQSCIDDGEDEKSVTRPRTPSFLQESTDSTGPLEFAPKRLTLNELTQCTKDSSQLASAMGAANNIKETNKDASPSRSHLEQSRRNKLLEREESNRKVAENLDKASEMWHSHIKVMDNKVSTHDSRGVKMSLFNDDPDLLEKSENEDSEKVKGSSKFSTGFADRLDILLQRGLRSPWLSKSMTNIRSLNERSHNRWTSKLDRFSSAWDLKYSSLHNKVSPALPMNIFPSQSLNSNSFLNMSTSCSPFSNLNIKPPQVNCPFNCPSPNLNNSANQCLPHPMAVSNRNDQFSNQYAPYLNSNQFNPYSNSVPMAFPPFQPNWTNQSVPSNYAPYYCHNHPYASFINNQPPPVPEGVFANHQGSINDGSNAKSKPMNANISDAFDSVSERITELAKKLDTLNSAVDRLTVNQPPIKIKPIIKTHKSSNQTSECDTKMWTEFNVMDDLAHGGTPLMPRPCNCENCNDRVSHYKSPITDRKVRFAFTNEQSDKETRDGTTTDAQIGYNNIETYKMTSSLHPHSVYRKHNVDIIKNKDNTTYARDG